MTQQTLGDRIKAYEACYDSVLPNGIPQILRLDGRAFHTLTRKIKLKKPFDAGFHQAMVEATIAVCDDVSNARFGYTQSDEISILIYPKYLNSQPYFGNRLNKILTAVSTIASLTLFKSLVRLKYLDLDSNILPTFDARLFTVPVHDVNNVFLWRQQDAIKNSVTGLAEAYYSGSELHQKCTATRRLMLLEKDIDWHALTSAQKFGTAVVYKTYEVTDNFGAPGEEIFKTVTRGAWSAQEVLDFKEHPEQINNLLETPTLVKE